MTYSNESYNLLIKLDTHGCELSAGEIEKMEENLATLRKLVERFPVSHLYVTVARHQRTEDFHVKTSLVLPGKTLFTGDRDETAHPAFERCVRKLVRKVSAYKQQMHADAELAKQATGSHHTTRATMVIDVERLGEAVRSEDYVMFRQAAGGFENDLVQRVGRWVQRYPEVQAQLGEAITISDIVEEVFLNAFEQFPHRPTDVPPGDWFEGLIDPSIQSLIRSPDDEFDNISFVRTMLEA